MKQIQIKPAFSAGWQSFKKQPWYLSGLTFAVFGLFALSLGNAIVTALAYIIYGGYLMLLVRHFRGKIISFDDIIPTNSRWISFSVLALVKTLFILIGFLLFIVPGIYLSVRWMFAELLVMDQGMRPLEALKASSTLTEGTRGTLFWFMLLMTLFTIAGLLFFIVGIFFTSTISLLAIISLYENLKTKLPTETSPPLPIETTENKSH